MSALPRAPGAGAGALVGLAVAAPVTAFLYVAHRGLGVPFPPYEGFELLAGALPGEVVTRGIELMVSGIRAVGWEDTAEAAKRIEQWSAVALFAGLCALLGAVSFLAARGLPGRRGGAVAALGGGTVLGAFLLWVVVLEEVEVSGLLVSLAAAVAWAAGLYACHRALLPAPAEVSPGRERLDRRTVVVRIGAATAVLTFAGVALSRALTRRADGPGVGGAGVPWSATHPLPTADAVVQPVPGTRPELTPLQEHYRIDINLVPPTIDPEAWRLRFDGLVDRPRAFTLEELQAYPALHPFITLSCISNPLGGDLIGTTRWTGVSLSRILDEVGLRPDATHLKITSADGFDEVLSVEEARADESVMLAYAWDGLPLAAEHGFPLRIYRPNRYGMKQPKWIERIEAIPEWEPGYWVRRGWSREAWMNATSVIDVVGEPMRNAQGETVVPIGGIAHAGARGISRVEVRVDDGPWSPAQVREPLSGKTWVLWRYEWPFEDGEHLFSVRCYDGTGTLQPTEYSPPHPGGATGIFKVTREV